MSEKALPLRIHLPSISFMSPSGTLILLLISIPRRPGRCSFFSDPDFPGQFQRRQREQPGHRARSGQRRQFLWHNPIGRFDRKRHGISTYPGGLFTTVLNFNGTNGDKFFRLYPGQRWQFLRNDLLWRFFRITARYSNLRLGDHRRLCQFDDGDTQIGPLLRSSGQGWQSLRNGGIRLVSRRRTIFGSPPSGSLTTLVNFNGTNGIARCSRSCRAAMGNFKGTILPGRVPPQ